MAATEHKMVVGLLAKKYARLKGELEVVERTIEEAIGLSAIIEATKRIDQRKLEINEALEHLEEVIWLFNVGWNPAAVEPIYPRQIKYKPGAISRGALNILRLATAPMTTREIAKEVAKALDVKDLNESKLTSIDSAVATTLAKRIGKSIQVHAGPPRRWSVKPAEEVAASAGVVANIPATRSRRGAALTRP
jgi:hypothetical protein